MTRVNLTSPNRRPDSPEPTLSVTKRRFARGSLIWMSHLGTTTRALAHMGRVRRTAVVGTLALFKHVPMRSLVSSCPSAMWPTARQAVCRALATASLEQHTHLRRQVRRAGSLSLSTTASPGPGQEVGVVSDALRRGNPLSIRHFGRNPCVQGTSQQTRAAFEQV